MSLPAFADPPPPVDAPVTTKVTTLADPNLQYIFDQFRDAARVGLPMASDGVKAICLQIQLFGLGLLIIHAVVLVLSAIGIWQGKKLWLYASDTYRSYDDLPVKHIGAVVLFAMSLWGVLWSLDVREPIMMTAAPVLWGLQSLFGG